LDRGRRPTGGRHGALGARRASGGREVARSRLRCAEALDRWWTLVRALARLACRNYAQDRYPAPLVFVLTALL
jgi:hypothetical protein